MAKGKLSKGKLSKSKTCPLPPAIQELIEPPHSVAYEVPTAMKTNHTIMLALCTAACLFNCGCDPPPLPPQGYPGFAPAAQKSESLFDGQTMEGWQSTSYGGEGEITIEGGCLVIGVGETLSGVTTTREDLPTIDYEVQLQAKKVSGIDFFCGITFPVNDTHCSFIVGGWAGTVVGFSCVDGKDASENPTSISKKFEKNQWYNIKLRVQQNVLTAWIDDQLVVTQDIEGLEVAVRNDADPSCPFGFCAFQTESHLRNIELMRLPNATSKPPVTPGPVTPGPITPGQ